MGQPCQIRGGIRQRSRLPAARAFGHNAAVTLEPLHLSERAARDLGFIEVQRVLASLCPSPFGKEELGREPASGGKHRA